MMIVGLKSGREFVVQDKCYTLTAKDGRLSHILIYPDGKRQVTVYRDDVEFFDELITDEVEKSIETMLNHKPEPEKIGVDYQ